MRRSSSAFLRCQATHVDGEACRGQSLYKEARRMWTWRDKRARLLFNWMTKHVMLSGLKALAGETHGKTFRPLSGSWFLLAQTESNHRGCVLLSITLTRFHLHLLLRGGGRCGVRSGFIDCKYLSRCFFRPVIQSFVTYVMMWKGAFEVVALQKVVGNAAQSVQRKPLICHRQRWSNRVTLVPRKKKKYSNRKRVFTLKDGRGPGRGNRRRECQRLVLQFPLWWQKSHEQSSSVKISTPFSKLSQRSEISHNCNEPKLATRWTMHHCPPNYESASAMLTLSHSRVPIKIAE